MIGDRREMIRLDDESDDEQQQAKAGNKDSEESGVLPHRGRLSEYVTKGGVVYQQCGGGRRRMPKRSN